MTIRFNLVAPNRVRSAIRVAVSHRGKIFQKSIGKSVEVARWSQSKQKTGIVDIDAEIRRVRQELERTIDDASTIREVEEAVERAIKPWLNEEAEEPDKPSFWPFFKEWSDRPSGDLRQKQLTYRVFFEIMKGRGDWEDIDSGFFLKLKRGMEDKGYSKNTQGVFIGRLKTCLNEAHALHLIGNDDFARWKKPHEDTFAIALSQEEVDAIWNADLSDNPVLSRTRDLAMLGILTAARYSDYSRLTEDNIQGDRLSFVQEKTEVPVLLPLSPKVVTIFERNGGRAPKICSQVFNRDIKRLGKLLGFDDIIECPPTTRKKLGKEKGEVVHKWELITTHTFRRTGATLLYMSGVPVRVCRYLTGHTKDSTFLNYIKVERDEAADVLAEVDFFK